MGTANITNLDNLQRALDATIERLGIERTTALLDNLGKGTVEFGPNRFKAISEFLVQRAISALDMDKDDFFTSEEEECKEARMICYDLLKSHTNCSYPKIMEVFGRNERSILYFRQKCRDHLSAPFFYRDFIKKYRKLETMLLTFMAELD